VEKLLGVKLKQIETGDDARKRAVLCCVAFYFDYTPRFEAGESSGVGGRVL